MAKATQVCIGFLHDNWLLGMSSFIEWRAPFSLLLLQGESENDVCWNREKVRMMHVGENEGFGILQ